MIRKGLVFFASGIREWDPIDSKILETEMMSAIRQIRSRKVNSRIPRGLADCPDSNPRLLHNEGFPARSLGIFSRGGVRPRETYVLLTDHWPWTSRPGQAKPETAIIPDDTR